MNSGAPRYSELHDATEGEEVAVSFDIQLDDEEQMQWSALSRSIGQAIARHGSLEKANRDPNFKLLLIRRSRIAKKASAKLEAARSIVSEYSE